MRDLDIPCRIPSAVSAPAYVQSALSDDLGKVEDLMIDTKTGQVDYAVVSFGGFLGIGEHPIAVTMDELQILQEENGSGVRIFIDSTQSELEKKPAYRS